MFMFQVIIVEQCILNLFFPASIKEWFHLDPSIRNYKKYNKAITASRQKILPFIRPLENSIFNIFDPVGLKLLIRLRLGFSHLNEHRFLHDFQECLNPLCTCSLETENTSHDLLHCHHKTPFRTGLTNRLKTSVVDFEFLSDSKKVKILLYRGSRCDDNKK